MAKQMSFKQAAELVEGRGCLDNRVGCSIFWGAAAQKALAAVSVFVVAVVSSILFVDRSDRAGRWSLIYSRRYSGC